MPTRSIVPRANGEGSLGEGSTPKRWGKAWLVDLDASGIIKARKFSLYNQSIATTIVHSGKNIKHAGNNGLGQSKPAYFKSAQSVEIAGTRTSDTVFTRTSGTWVANALVGQYCYSYVSTSPASGIWLPITANTTTALTVSGTLYPAATAVRTCIWLPNFSLYAHSQGSGAFIGGVFDGESIWLVPYNSANLVKVNPADGSMTTYAHGQGGGAFRCGTFDGESIWLVPYTSANLVKVNPAGFGRNPSSKANKNWINRTASRALGTVYTNPNTSRALLIMATVRCAISVAAGYAYVQAFSDASATPTAAASGKVGIEVGLLNEDNTFQVTFIVRANEKYKITATTSNGTCTLGNWTEVVL